MTNFKLLELINPLKTEIKDFSKYSDKKLMCLCKKYGEQTLGWRRKFIGLLPEVDRRRLYLKKGFSSIFEFGKRFGGLSEDQIRLTLNLGKRFENKPTLHKALIEGEVSVNKLTRIASIATVENEGFLLESAKVLSSRSLEVFVKDLKRVACGERGENGLFEPRNELKSLHVQRAGAERELSSEYVENGTRLNFFFNAEVTKKLNELHNKGINVNEILLKMLEKREEAIIEEKANVSENVRNREEQRKTDGRQ